MGNGQDKITGGDGETIAVGNGNDTVSVGSNSTIKVGNGNDTIIAGGDSIIPLGKAADTLAFGIAGGAAGSYSRCGQRRELWYTRTISIVEARTR